MTHSMPVVAKVFSNTLIFLLQKCEYEGESIKKQPYLFLGEIDLFFFDVIAL